MTVDVYCVPDTNFFHHFQFFADVDWLNLMEAPLVNVVLTAPVLEELERHKNDNTSDRRRNRSRAALRKFDELLESSQDATSGKIKDGTFLKVDVEAVDESAFADGLDSRLPDDRIIAHALRLREETGQHVILITDDMGMRIKASARGLNVLRPPESLQLRDEPTDSEQKIRRLESELDLLRSRIPQLALGFTDADPPNTLVATFRDADSTPDDIDRQVDEAERQLRRKYHLPGVIPAAVDYSGLGDRITQYLVRYREYLEKLERHRRLVGSLAPIALTLSNEGAAPAVDIILELEAPPGTRFLRRHQVPKEPVPPREPHVHGITDILLPSAFTPIDGWHTRSETAVAYNMEQLLHNMDFDLDPIMLYVPPGSRSSPCEMGYRLHAGNVPDPLAGTLVVRESDASVESSSVSHQ